MLFDGKSFAYDGKALFSGFAGKCNFMVLEYIISQFMTKSINLPSNYEYKIPLGFHSYAHLDMISLGFGYFLNHCQLRHDLQVCLDLLRPIALDLVLFRCKT